MTLLRRFWPTLLVSACVLYLAYAALFPGQREEPCNDLYCPAEREYALAAEATAIAEGRIERD